MNKRTDFHAVTVDFQRRFPGVAAGMPHLRLDRGALAHRESRRAGSHPAQGER